MSHWLGDKIYAFGGGMDAFGGGMDAFGGGMAFPGGGWGLFPDGTLWEGGNAIAMDALVGTNVERGKPNRLRSVLSSADPFNYNLPLLRGGNEPFVGDSVVYGFITPQVFISRSWNAVVEGTAENNPRLLGIFDQGGNLVDEKGRLLGDKAVDEILKGM